MKSVTLYTTRNCPYCINAKTLLNGKGVNFEEIGVDTSAQALAEMMQRSGRRSVPQIFIESLHVGGFDDLAMLERSSKLDQLLRD